MLWEHYVYRRGNEVYELWDDLFNARQISLLYIAGRGFDTRAVTVLSRFVSSCNQFRQNIRDAKLVLIGFEGYQLDDDIRALTEENATRLESSFVSLGTIETTMIRSTNLAEGDSSTANSLREGIAKVLAQVVGHTDIILDVSSLPRVAYLTLLTSLLNSLVPNKKAEEQGAHPLFAGGVNLQILVAEDAALDGHIRAEDPSHDLVMIPGFAGALQAESVQDWPLVWFPILGENRANQLQKVMDSAPIPSSAEICPLLPHPSRDPRRGDRLLIEYGPTLFATRETPMSNILYAHEAHPFETYRRLLNAMKRYRESMSILGGCRLVVTPLGSKLITVGAGLACFEMRPVDLNEKFGVAIPYAEPTRYIAPLEKLKSSSPEVCCLLLTGGAYE